MRFGLFLMPSHPPERPTAEAIEWDLSVVERADQLGFHEAWFGEHFTAPWEPLPAHDLIIAQALQRTTRMTLCSGAYLLPFHHPAELALRIAQLDHMAQGRYILGIGAGSIPTDFRLFNVDALAGQQRAMTKEALEIMIRIWTDPDPWEYRGTYWTVNNPEPYLAYGPHLVPFQRPHPPIAVAGLSPRSETLRLAGECGYIPLSLTFNAQYLQGPLGRDRRRGGVDGSDVQPSGLACHTGHRRGRHRLRSPGAGGGIAHGTALARLQLSPLEGVRLAPLPEA